MAAAAATLGRLRRVLLQAEERVDQLPMRLLRIQSAMVRFNSSRMHNSSSSNINCSNRLVLPCFLCSAEAVAGEEGALHLLLRRRLPGREVRPLNLATALTVTPPRSRQTTAHALLLQLHRRSPQSVSTPLHWAAAAAASVAAARAELGPMAGRALVSSFSTRCKLSQFLNTPHISTLNLPTPTYHQPPTSPSTSSCSTSSWRWLPWRLRRRPPHP